MRLHPMLIVAMIAAVLSGPAKAADILLHFNNMSGKSIVGLFATPKGESVVSEVNLVQAGDVAAAATGEVTVASAEPVCVYDLRIQFGDGSSLDRPDVDLCQTDELIIE